MNTNINIIFATCLALCLLSCTSVKYLPSQKQISRSPYGTHIVIVPIHGPSVRGELMAVDSSHVYLLNHKSSELMAIDQDLVKSFQIQVAHTNNTIWVPLLFPVISMSHGLFLLFTLPFNIVTTTVITQQPMYTIKSSKISYEQLCKFARFPQGLPRDYL